MMADILDFNDAPVLRVIDPQEYERRLELLRQRLATAAPDLVRELFPRARIQGHEARIGNVDGDPGESLSIGLQGDRAGLWFDHATSDGGDLIDLWQRATRSNDFLQVVEELERWCGMTAAPRWTSRIHKVGEARRQAAQDTPSAAPATLGEPVAQWIYTSADGTHIATVKRFDLAGQFDDTGKQKKTFRPFLSNGAPGMPDPRPLYRQGDLVNAERVILVEGEKCADALASIGIPATTAMGGANSNPGKTDWSPLAGKHVTIWPDNDEPGRAMPDKVRAALEGVGARVSVLATPSGKPLKWDAADAVAEGFDVSALLSARSERPKVPIFTRRQLREMKRPEWLVDEVLVERSVLSLYGPSGSLKSFVAIGFAMSVATGTAWHGRDVKAGSVIYVTGEGRDQIDGRYEAWERLNDYHGEAAIFTVPMGISISDPEWVGHLIEAVEGLCPKPPAMIWLDTLARTFGAGDENSQKDMNAFVSGVDRLRDHFGAVIGVVHHTGKDDAKGLRGSSALYAAMDTVIRTDRKAGKMIVVLKNQQPHGKQKDAGEFEDITLEAQVVKLGVQDSKGRDLTSLALVLSDAQPVEGDDDDRPSADWRPRGANQKTILAVLKKAKGEPLGTTRLAIMAKIDISKLRQAVAPMVANGLVIEEGEEGNKRWTLA